MSQTNTAFYAETIRETACDSNTSTTVFRAHLYSKNLSWKPWRYLRVLVPTRCLFWMGKNVSIRFSSNLVPFKRSNLDLSDQFNEWRRVTKWEVIPQRSVKHLQFLYQPVKGRVFNRTNRPNTDSLQPLLAVSAHRKLLRCVSRAGSLKGMLVGGYVDRARKLYPGTFSLVFKLSFWSKLHIEFR